MISSLRISHPIARPTPRCSDRFEQCQNDKGQSFDSGLKQIDDVISRIPDIRRRAKNAKNSLAPINKLPPETLAQVAAFLEPGRQLSTPLQSVSIGARPSSRFRGCGVRSIARTRYNLKRASNGPSLPPSRSDWHISACSNPSSLIPPGWPLWLYG